MKILVLNGSPSGENSITLQTVNYIQKSFPEHEYDILHVGQRIKSYEKDFSPCISLLHAADLIVFCYPVYTFIVPAQLHRFIELIKENNVNLTNKYATQISTSKHFYDVTAHRFIQDNCYDLRMNYLRGLSEDMDDLLTEKGRKEAIDFFKFITWNIEHGFSEPNHTDAADTDPAIAAVIVPETETAKTASGKVIIVADTSNDENSNLQNMIDRFIKVSPNRTEVIDIKDFPFAGGCLGCFHCAGDGKCVYKDGFDDFLRNNIQTADATVYAYTIKDHSMGSRFKMFDDRQFCNGHRTVTMGKPVGYLVSGMLLKEENLRMIMESRSQVGGNYLAGIASNEMHPDEDIDQLANILSYAIENRYEQPANFFGVGGMKIFRDLIYQMQGMMQADHKFYKEHGFYDFPQKKKGRIIFMYLVGAMMKNKKFKGKMTEGMMMPYKKLLEDADKKKS